MENTLKKNQLIQLISGVTSIVVSLGLIITSFLVNFFAKKNFVPSFEGEKFAPAWYIYVLYIVGSIILLVGAYFIYQFVTSKKEIKKINVRQMTLIAFLSAITIVLYYFAKFNLPFFPPWLDIQVSELPALIGTFIYGPWAGSLIIFIRFVIKLPGTITAGVGELADLILGLVLVLVAGIIYKKHRTLKGALVACSVAVVCASICACFVNWLILIPAYVKLANFPMEALVGMLSYIKVNGESVVTLNNFMLYYVFVGVLPFNILRYIIVLALTFLLYKRTHWLFEKIAK
ncbi:MAG: ECF transporter S component [Bacillales bacterium]|nr:ECF transporter S component [Bacillales bacterium]